MTTRTMGDVPDHICLVLGFKPSAAALKAARTLATLDKNCGTAFTYPSCIDIERTMSRMEPLWNTEPSALSEAEHKMRFAFAMMACKALRIFASTGKRTAARVCVELAEIVRTRRVLSDEGRLKAMPPEEISLANDVCGAIKSSGDDIFTLGEMHDARTTLLEGAGADGLALTYHRADRFLAWVYAGADPSEWRA